MHKAHVKLCKGVSNDGQYHVVMNYYVTYSDFYFVLYRQRGERCSPSPLPRPSDPSTYRLNCVIDAGPSSHYKCKLKLCNMNYNLPKPIRYKHKCFIDAFLSCFSAVASPRSRRKAYNTAESRPCTEIAIVNNVRLNIRQNYYSDGRYRCQNIDISDTGVTTTGIDT